MDWGIAVREDERFPPGPRGTPVYMAPELVDGRSEDIGPWTDVYLLGALLYEILAGHPPHKRGSLLAVIEAALASEPAPLPASIPEELRVLALKTLSRRREDRPASARDFQRALETFLEHREARAVSDKAAEVLEGCRRQVAGGPALKSRERHELHARFSEAVAGFHQSRHLWPQNPAAIAGEDEARAAYARFALMAGDFDLAEAQVTRLSKGHADKAPLRSELREGVAEAARKDRRRHQLAYGLSAAIGVLVLGLTYGLYFTTSTNARLERQKAEILAERNKAQQAQQRAEKESARARQEQARAEEQEQRVKERIKDLRGSYGLLITTLRSEFTKIVDPQIQPLQRRLLERALASLESIQRDLEADEGELSDLVAEGYSQLADLARESGSIEAAIAYSEKSLVIQRRLLKAVPAKRSLRYYSVLNQMTKLSDLYRFVDKERSEAHRQEMRAELRQLIASPELRPRFPSPLADARVAAGDELRRRGQLARAEEAYRQARDQLRSKLSAKPEDRAIREALIIVLDRRAELLCETSSKDAAAAANEAFEVASALAATDATDPLYLEYLHHAQLRCAVLLFQSGDLESTRKLTLRTLRNPASITEDSARFQAFTRAANAYGREDWPAATEGFQTLQKLLERALEREPLNGELLDQLADCRMRLSLLARVQNRLDEEAVANLEAARTIRVGLLERDPTNLPAFNEARILHQDLSKLEIARGRPNAACAALREMVALTRRFAPRVLSDLAARRMLFYDMNRLVTLRFQQPGPKERELLLEALELGRSVHAEAESTVDDARSLLALLGLWTLEFPQDPMTLSLAREGLAVLDATKRRWSDTKSARLRGLFEVTVADLSKGR